MSTGTDGEIPVDLLALCQDESCPIIGQDKAELSALPVQEQSPAETPQARGVSDAPVEEAVRATPVIPVPGFFNARFRSGNYNVQREQPIHRLMCYMKLQGKTLREIGDACDRTPQNVSDILGQPWAQQFMAEEAAKHGEPMVEMILKGEALNSITRIIEIRDDKQVSAETRRKAANDLLDRVYGKPNQPITHRQAADLDNMSDEELAKIVANGRTN